MCSLPAQIADFVVLGNCAGMATILSCAKAERIKTLISDGASPELWPYEWCLLVRYWFVFWALCLMTGVKPYSLLLSHGCLFFFLSPMPVMGLLQHVLFNNIYIFRPKQMIISCLLIWSNAIHKKHVYNDSLIHLVSW